MVEAFFRKVLQRTYLPELTQRTLASNIIKTQNAYYLKLSLKLVKTLPFTKASCVVIARPYSK